MEIITCQKKNDWDLAKSCDTRKIRDERKQEEEEERMENEEGIDGSGRGAKEGFKSTNSREELDLNLCGTLRIEDPINSYA